MHLRAADQGLGMLNDTAESRRRVQYPLGSAGFQPQHFPLEETGGIGAHRNVPSAGPG